MLTERQQVYHDYLQSSIWKALRKEALERAGWRCQVCNTGKKLEVHHRCYPDVLGTEDVSDLTVLCQRCHALYTNKVQKAPKHQKYTKADRRYAKRLRKQKKNKAFKEKYHIERRPKNPRDIARKRLIVMATKNIERILSSNSPFTDERMKALKLKYWQDKLATAQKDEIWETLPGCFKE